jgi:4-hydroxythreonine-4-phosphate dehydrogenase
MNENNSNNQPVIGVSIGDVNGIGPEVIIKTFSDNRILNYCVPVIYGNIGALNYHKKILEDYNINFQIIRDVRDARPGKVYLINVSQENIRITLRQPGPDAGILAFLALKAVVNDARSGLIEGILTAPINKKSIQSDEFDFPGHTEYLMDQFRVSDTVMLMVGEDLKAGLVTGHYPLSEVPENITPERIISKLRILQGCLIEDFAIEKPKIGVLGLNPHAGEEGLLGNEEQDIIIPALEKARREGILAFGPYPADGYFGMHQYHTFDATLAMYHDQGLAPFKLLNFERGVNYTAGLPVPRTSPDHGTAYDIAGKNCANEQSFREALYLLLDIIKNREIFAEINENPLQSQITREKEI